MAILKYCEGTEKRSERRENRTLDWDKKDANDFIVDRLSTHLSPPPPDTISGYPKYTD